MRSYVNVPLMFEGSLVATMNLASDVPGAFQVEHLDIAREVSSMLAVGILQSDLREERRRRSDILEELVAERTLALAQREQQYRTLARLFPDGIVAMFDRDLRYSFVDGMALVSAGLSGDEFQGRTLWEAPHDPDSVLVFEPAFRAALEGIPSVFEMRAQDRDFLVHVVPVDGEGVAIVGGLMASVDITDRKRAEADLARFAAIVESADDAIYSKTLAGTITSWNRGAEKLYGFPAAEAIGQPVSIICPPGREDELSAILEAVRAGAAVERRETVRRRSDGRLIDVALTVSPVKADGIVTGASVIGHDITERKRFQRELLEAKDEAERANRAKDGFLSRMSHELRTPLNAVLGFAQVLEMDELSSDQRDSVEQIRRGGEHLLELINEVLDLSRIAGGGLRLSLERVAVSEALRDAVSLVQPLAAERGVSLRVEDADGLHVLADHQRLKQVLLNLLANAIKYNRKGGEVSVGCEQTGEQGLRITVSDSGPGISPEQMTRLFEPFERLGAEGGDVEGTGLGLTLSKALMVAMGGTIQVQSEVGVGSRFAIDLARAGSQDRDDQRPHPGFDEPKAGLTQIVLHVGDNLDDLRLVERILEQRPAIRLISAMQGQMALDLARRHRPSLILLDPHLPDIHGAQVLQALRRDAATKDIPVVMISADATRPEERQLLEAGASGYLTEPLDVRRFLEVVDGVLGGS